MTAYKAGTTYKFDVVNDGMVTAPIWNSHHRAKNWAAIIDVDGTAPGGYSRRFLPRGRGPVFYLVEQVGLFDVIEFAADYVTYAGRKDPERWYGIVVAKTDEFMHLEFYDDGAPACLAARKKRTSREDVLKALRTEKEHLDARSAALADEIEATLKAEEPKSNDKEES